MTNKHTQGGWNRNIKPASKYPVIFAGRNTHVAMVCTSGLSEEEIEANINLIAAAPDLLEALRGMLLEAQGDITPACDKARAIINKAVDNNN